MLFVRTLAGNLDLAALPAVVLARSAEDIDEGVHTLVEEREPASNGS